MMMTTFLDSRTDEGADARPVQPPSPRRLGVALRIVLAAAAAAACAAAVVHFASDDADSYVTASPAITFRYVGVQNESMLVDFCFQLQTIRGITGVTYRDYVPKTGTVMLTVYYNPRLASPQQVLIFLEYTKSIWSHPRSA